jgi:DNA-directed RNA polymerase specialized sigma24 family protein
MKADAAGRAALTDLYQAHQVGLIRMAVLLVGDEATAEDVVQDVFLRMQDKLPKLDDESKLLAYVRASVLNGCRMSLRRRKRMSAAVGCPGSRRRWTGRP